MLLCYLDESGNTGNNLKDIHQPYLVLTALLVPPEAIRSIEDDLRALCYRYFAAESRNTDFELHGDDIYNARGRYFKRLPLSQRIQLLNDIIEILIAHTSIRIGYIAIEKGRYFAKLHIQQTAFSLLVEHIEERLQGHLDSYCLLIADEQDELEQRLIDDLDRFKQQGTEFGYKHIQVSRIIDSVHFVQSHNNFLMQLTDVTCYLIRRGHEARKKLRAAYADYKKENTVSEYKQWRDTHAHRGYRYFEESYEKINKEKPWIFSKDFP